MVVLARCAVCTSVAEVLASLELTCCVWVGLRAVCGVVSLDCPFVFVCG